MFGKKHAAESGKKKYLYMFEEGNKDMRELLGGKGANLAEMTNAGMPVPPRIYHYHRGLHPVLHRWPPDQ